MRTFAFLLFLAVWSVLMIDALTPKLDGENWWMPQKECVRMEGRNTPLYYYE